LFRNNLVLFAAEHHCSRELFRGGRPGRDLARPPSEVASTALAD
jgi:hypothetical protein